MSELLREVLRERAAVPPPVFDAAGLVARAERRSRRRLVSVVAAVVVTAVAAGGVLLGPRLGEEPAPVDRPARFAEPRLTYAVGAVVHYGDQTFDTGVLGNSWLERTDYGFVLVSSGDVWFSDGSDTEKIGRHLGSKDNVTVDATGALVAWVGRAEDGDAVVVYDSRKGAVVARIPAGPRWFHPGVVAIDDNAVYWHSGSMADPLLRYDVGTGEQTAVELSPAYVTDVANGVFAYWTPDLGHGQVVVGSPRASSTIDGLSHFNADLSPDASHVAGYVTGSVSGLGVFDVATGERVVLRPPRGYGVDWFMGWVDSNTAAAWDADQDAILTCSVPSGSCQVAVQDPGYPRPVWRPVFPAGYRPG